MHTRTRLTQLGKNTTAHTENITTDFVKHTPTAHSERTEHNTAYKPIENTMLINMEVEVGVGLLPRAL